MLCSTCKYGRNNISFCTYPTRNRPSNCWTNIEDETAPPPKFVKGFTVDSIYKTLVEKSCKTCIHHNGFMCTKYPLSGDTNDYLIFNCWERKE